MSERNKKIIAIILVFVIVGFIGLILFLVYKNGNTVDDMDITTTSTTLSSTSTSTTITTSTTTTTTKPLVDLTNDEKELVSKLYPQIINIDKEFGLYGENITINDTNNVDFIKFNIRQYILENNIDYRKNIVCGIEIAKDNAYILPKDTLNKYIQKKYNTTNTYNVNINKPISLEFGTTEMITDEDNYIIGCLAKSGDSQTIFSKISKLDKKTDEIVMYEKTFKCMYWGGITFCSKKIDARSAEDEMLFKSENEEDYIFIEDAANYVFENKLDEIITYKHIFEKSSDGNYYWKSTQIVR